MLEVQNLNKSLGALQTLKDLSLGIQPGEILGFVGSNGAGKTIAMRIMPGVLPTDSGRASWNGREVDDDVRHKIGYMSEERDLYPKIQVGRQLEYFARLHRFGKAEATRMTEQWTDRLGVVGRRNDNVQKLLLGDQQRIQLTAVPVHDLIVLVLDEPFFGLDPVAADVMSQVFKGKAKLGVPIVFSSHQLDPVERSYDRVGIVPCGSIVAEDTIHELCNTGKPQIASAASAGPDRVYAALASVGVKPQPDPLEGTPNAPNADGSTRVIIDAEEIDDQVLLRVALSVGPIRELTPRCPHLVDLFKDVVAAVQPEEPTQKGRRGIFGRRKDVAR